MIIRKVMVKLKKLLRFERNITFSNHIYQNMILDRLMLIMILVIKYTLSIYDIKKIFENSQLIEVEFNFDGVTPAGIYD